jgi:hypothetical protein
MPEKAAVFCHNGLGDGIVSLVLPNNLHLNGWAVTTFQNTLPPLQAWFPHLTVLPYPPQEQIFRLLGQFDWFFVFQNDSSPFIQQLIAEGKRRFPERVKVIYIYPSPHIVRERYYFDSQIDPRLPVAENMRLFCERILRLPKTTESPGLIPPYELVHRREERRIAIHPTSSREGKNWLRERYVKLALHLKAEGYEPVYVADESWNSGEVPARQFPTLDLLARFLYESGYLIGNDSGLGHLASALGIPTLTITRRKALALLWGPSFAPGAVVTPSRWIPNIRGFRLRDRQWKRWISVAKVRSAFAGLVKKTADRV